jgi:hypothetical protein
MTCVTLAGAWATNSFHNSQRHCYHHPSYRWWLPRGSEQACLDELLLARVCRRLPLWAYRYAYSNEAKPPNSYHIETHYLNLCFSSCPHRRNMFLYAKKNLSNTFLKNITDFSVSIHVLYINYDPMSIPFWTFFHQNLRIDLVPPPGLEPGT